MNPLLTKAYNAGGAIGPGLFVKFSGAGTVVLGAAATDAVIGVSRQTVSAATGDRVDVQHVGIADVFAGGSITRGGLVTCDGAGKAVASSPSTGTTDRSLGIALESAAAGDIIPVLLNIGQQTTP
jgi:hypothetical protein